MVVLYLSIYLCLRHMLCWVLLVLEILVVVGNYIALGPHSCKMKRVDTDQWAKFTFGVLCISSVSEIAWLWHMCFVCLAIKWHMLCGGFGVIHSCE